MASVVAALLVITVLGWNSTRFHRISICLSCHEIFEDNQEIEPTGELSQSVEDFNPKEAIEPALFHVSVGCAECHAYPYEEYRESAHYDNENEIRPGCIGCHDQHSAKEFVQWKFLYVNRGGMGESPFHAITNTLRDIPSWEELRKVQAKTVRERMIADQSAKCKNCHKKEGEWFKKFEIHKKEKTCIQCHYNLVHRDVKWHQQTGNKSE